MAKDRTRQEKSFDKFMWDENDIIITKKAKPGEFESDFDNFADLDEDEELG